MTATIDRMPNSAASQNTAVMPNIQPSRPDNPAPAMLPAWLNAWLTPICLLKPDWWTMPSVMPLTAGPIAAPAIAEAICEADTRTNDCDSRITADASTVQTPGTTT